MEIRVLLALRGCQAGSMEGVAGLTCAPQGPGPQESSVAHRFPPTLLAHCGEAAAEASCGGPASVNTFKSEVTGKAIYGDSSASDHFPQGSRRPSAPLLASPSRQSLNH